MGSEQTGQSVDSDDADIYRRKGKKKVERYRREEKRYKFMELFFAI